MECDGYSFDLAASTFSARGVALSRREAVGTRIKRNIKHLTPILLSDSHECCSHRAVVPTRGVPGQVENIMQLLCLNGPLRDQGVVQAQSSVWLPVPRAYRPVGEPALHFRVQLREAVHKTCV